MPLARLMVAHSAEQFVAHTLTLALRHDAEAHCPCADPDIHTRTHTDSDSDTRTGSVADKGADVDGAEREGAGPAVVEEVVGEWRRFLDRTIAASRA